MRATDTAPTALQRYLPWLVACAGFAFDLAAFWPGQMSFDSAYAWWQARGGATTDIVPPVFVWVWRACDLIVKGPGALFALHLALFWGGLALLLRALRFNSLATLATVILVAFAPLPWLLRSHVWTDVGLFSVLCFVAGALATAQLECNRRWLLLALPCLLYAGALRHNALPALLPFTLWFGWLAVRGRDPRPAKLQSLTLATATLLALIVLSTLAIDATAQRRVPLWPMLAQWDLAAVSVATGQMRLPDFMIGPGLDVAELTAAFRGWSTAPMLQNTQHGVRDPFVADFSADQLATLRTAWLDAILGDPRAWLAHRWRLTRFLFGTHAADWPRELIFVDAQVRYGDNPDITPNTTALHKALMRAAASQVATLALTAWLYLLVGLLALPSGWRRRRSAAGMVALTLLASAWLYALPFTMLAASAELRYLGWPCVASLLAFACAAFAPRSGERC